MLGVIPPVLGKWLTANPHAVPARVIKTFSAGIVVALALVSCCFGYSIELDTRSSRLVEMLLSVPATAAGISRQP
jgi:hypothetical protein